MAVESNIDMYYEELIESLAERAYDNMKDGGYGDEDECVWSAVDDGLIYYCDQAYVVANALQNGFISWGKTIEWDAINDMLYSDVKEALEEMKKGEEGEEGRTLE